MAKRLRSTGLIMKRKKRCSLLLFLQSPHGNRLSALGKMAQIFGDLFYSAQKEEMWFNFEKQLERQTPPILGVLVDN